MARKNKVRELVTPSECPAWLPEEARQVWEKTISMLVKDGLYDPSADDLIAAYSATMGAIIAATKRGETPKAAHLSQLRLLAISVGLDPEERRRRLWMKRNEI